MDRILTGQDLWDQRGNPSMVLLHPGKLHPVTLVADANIVWKKQGRQYAFLGTVK